MNESSELKPCPFCGGDNVTIKQRLDMMGTPCYSVECPDCRMLAGDYYGAREAANNWNRRPLATLCQWKEDDYNVWDTDCDNSFIFEEGDPAENNFKFCPYCGRVIAAVPYGDEEE